MEKENIPGQMVESIRVSGKTICFTVEEFTHGQMAEDMKVITKTIKKTDKVYTHGQIKNVTMVDGKTASNMVKLHLLTQKDKAKEVYGKMEIELSGLVPPKITVNQTYDHGIATIGFILTVFTFT